MKQQLDAIFVPGSVAVIGASARPGAVGREVLRNLFRAEFNGKVFPVNPGHQVLHSAKCYPSVLDIPDAVDLAVIIVPKGLVAETVGQCGEKGIKAVVVISSGFSEVGSEGKVRENEVVKVCQQYGIRMIGPNCFGVVNTDPNIRLNATFGKIFPHHGNVGFITQSGAMSEAIMNQAGELGLGFSKIASIGNKADISSNDVLAYLKDDPQTDVILMYMENFGNPRNFTSIAREVSRVKPIVAVKSGRTQLGAKAASSHTGALAGLDVGVDALFEQTGVMRVDTTEELFDVAAALSFQKVPRGNRVMVVTNAGGPGVLATDALINYGMEMPSLARSTVAELKTFLSANASFSNPMDMASGAGGKEFYQTLNAVKKDKRYDTILTLFVPPITIDSMDVARKICQAVKDTDKVVLTSLMGVVENTESIDYLRKEHLPVYIFPEAAAKALATIDGYRKWLARPKGKLRHFKVDKKRVEAIIDQNVRDGSGSIIGRDAIAVLEAYGIPAAEYEYAFSAREAVTVARRMEYPVVLKVNTPRVLHKTEMGGVLVDLRSDAEVRKGFETLHKRVGRLKKGEEFSVVVQRMVTGTAETVIGMTTDPSFGPLLMFGLGGIYVEVMKDVAFRINPLTDQAARAMIQSLKSYPLLTGFRGAPPVDLDILEETLLRVSQLVRDFSCLAEIDINPFIVSDDRNKCRAVDARFIIKPECA